ncbi:MAG: bacillithiol biosynthesis deacetylase BshB1 [Candidatus Accumulibacter appositus]|uniref:Bacillithiol biosynthesis deacetylase BshB1 n=1 Tax=Candidatus Accumulibacter appositus TaxID=1454003 RepID=A0A011PM20_9PROT|nr:PIG-L family deacetylase [Accumulibacter sp.]EXI78052.1 MAG: bacillithiol biosynthesis deacetylase BshB1 [Candidatus Accumulibacter appositus]HRF05993.1 PIG-L family deacetylase [Accumulibacter sp.]
MTSRKQQLLQRHRQRKRFFLLAAVLLLAALAIFVAWWLLPVLLLCAWVAHEAWFADHLFYSPQEDYQYAFPAGTARQSVTLSDGRVQLSAPLAAGETLLIELHLRSTVLGRCLDPHVVLGDDRQDFERGVRGRRYLNLSGQAAALASGQLSICGRFCRLPATATLYVLDNPDYAQRRMMIIAPHADDAELAAFGLYSGAALAAEAGQGAQLSIVTLTQGEIEADRYRCLGLDAAAAARLKGRLRTWDSLAVPLWGGVPQSRCVHLGYYCLQLPAMLAEPERPWPSRESGEADVRSARAHNPFPLPADADGLPCGNNLLADLVALLEQFRPEVVVMPHPELDPHADHVAGAQALLQAVERSSWKPEIGLLYANHLHDNDRWPMGPAGQGIALPPALAPLPPDALWSPCLSDAVQLDKAMALAMQHDLQGRLPFKKRLRRAIQKRLAARQWPASGENEFFRKAVRRHELFWVRRLDRPRLAAPRHVRVGIADSPPAASV